MEMIQANVGCSKKRKPKRVYVTIRGKEKEHTLLCIFNFDGKTLYDYETTYKDAGKVKIYKNNIYQANIFVQPRNGVIWLSIVKITRIYTFAYMNWEYFFRQWNILDRRILIEKTGFYT